MREREVGREGSGGGMEGSKGDVMDMYCDSVVMEMANVTLMVWLIQWRRNHGCAGCWRTPIEGKVHRGSYSGILESSGPKAAASSS